jgi:uncharacterized RDD family membrane protein YckC
MADETGRRALGSWLDGPASVLPGTGWAGQRLGLPQSGPGSVATLGQRIGATVMDLVVAFLAGGLVLLVDRDASLFTRNLVATGTLLAMWLVLWSTVGQSIGMRVMRIRMISRAGVPPRPWWVLLRILLLVVPVPFATSFTLDGDNRGIQDKACGVIVIRV